MRLSKYRIHAVTFATGTGRTWDAPDVNWRLGLEYYSYANTERGLRAQITRMLRDFTDGQRVVETTTLNADNNPADNLFKPGVTAKLDTGELERVRVTYAIGNPFSPFTYGRVYVHAERSIFGGGWEH